MSRVFLGIGSNVDAERWIPNSIKELRSRFGALDISPVYRNKAVGFGGDDFLNLVVGLNTGMSVDRLATVLRQIEQECGRRRGPERFTSRTLDIDILLFGDLCVRKDGFQLPRDEILEAAYVLKPLADIAPDAVHPETGQTFAEHWAAFEQDAHELVEVPLL